MRLVLILVYIMTRTGGLVLLLPGDLTGIPLAQL
jgi:hypothetical protein